LDAINMDWSHASRMQSGGMNEKNTTDSWIHIETFNATHSWTQTWIFLVVQ